jgi:hypothetical protein
MVERAVFKHADRESCQEPQELQEQRNASTGKVFLQTRLLHPACPKILSSCAEGVAGDGPGWTAAEWESRDRSTVLHRHTVVGRLDTTCVHDIAA